VLDSGEVQDGQEVVLQCWDMQDIPKLDDALWDTLNNRLELNRANAS
jgi:DNA polymerase IIIc chi subunit